VTNVTLYTTGCPKCTVLEAKLQQAGISFIKSADVRRVIDEGFRTAPVLEVDGEMMEFGAAVEWVRSNG
jgi:glutaredoxin